MTIVQGGFGSAGSSRSLRKTMTGAGVRSTATTGKFRSARMGKPEPIENVSKEDIWRGIKAQHCPFCMDMRTFKSLSGHLTRGHGFDLQDLRDYLGVPKGYSFISEELAETQAERGRRLYDPEKLKQHGGPRSLSQYGIKRQREKLLLAQARQEELGTRNIVRICQICGGEFYKPHPRHRTCGKICAGDLKSANFLGRKAPWVHPPHKPPSDKQCSFCDKTFNPRLDFGNSNRRTCSDACAHNLLSQFQRQRDLTYLREAKQRYDAARPVKYCSVTGCSNRYLSKGLCNAHYQRSRYKPRGDA